MTAIDRAGHPVTAAPASVERFDAAVGALLLLADDVEAKWDAAVADEPDFALGQIGRAYLRCISSEGPDAAEARKILDDLGDGAGLTDRERRHLDAARAYAEGDLHGAAERLAALSIEYPRDALALVIGHQLDFFCGDLRSLNDRVGRVLLAWDPADPWFGFVLGLQAFGLEERGLYPQAEAAGMAALDRQPRDVWAVHAVAHIHEMLGRFHQGLRFLDERRADWAEGTYLAVHNAWHEALFWLESGDLDRPLSIYDRILHHDGSGTVAMEMVDAAALLWRLHLDGVEDGGRWAALADAWSETLDDPWYVFNDVHAAMSFVGAGRLDEARALVERLDVYVSYAQPAMTNLAMTAEVGLPVCRAIVAFGEGRYDVVVDLLHPIRNVAHRFGGSHAQRDALARTLLEAALRAGNNALAQALLSERLAVKASSPYAWRQLGRLRRTTGDAAGADAADATVASLQRRVAAAS